MDKVQNIFFGPSPTNIPPGTKIRRWDTAIGGGVLVGLMVFFLCVAMLWRPLPILGEINRSVPLLTHARYWLEILLALMSGGNWFADDASRYIHAVNRLPFGTIWGRLLIAGSASLALGFYITRALLIPRDQIIHIDGARLLTGSDAQRQVQRTSKIVADAKKGFMRIHPDLLLPKSKWTKHTLIYGGVGSGKTQILIPILRRIFKANHKAILYDVKGDFTSYFPNALLISPWDARSAIWDIGFDVSTRDAAQEFASSIIPTNERDPFWTNAAQFLMMGIVFSLQSEKGTDWGWRELAERCNYDQANLFELMTKHYPKGANVIADPTSPQTGSVISTLAAYTRLIDDLAVAWGNTEGREHFSLRKWLRSSYTGPRQIILQAGKGEKLTSAYIAAMINAVVPEIISPALADNEQGRTLFFVLDEFTSLAKIKIQPLLDKGRSKGVCCVLGFQDVAQVRKVYGNDDARSITSMVGTHIVCRVGPGETRDLIATQIIGKRRVATLNTNVSTGNNSTTRTTSYHEEERPIIMPAQLSSDLGVQQDKTPAGFSIRALYLSDGDVLMLDWPGTDTRKLKKRPSYIEAEWVKPIVIQQSKVIPFVPVAASAISDGIDHEITSDATEAMALPSPEITSSNDELLAVVTELPPQEKPEVEDSPDALAHAATENLAAGIGGGVEVVATLAAVVDALDGGPVVKKPTMKVFTGNVSRRRA